MRYFIVILSVILNIQLSQCANPSCRTNCSTNGTSVDESCWRAALTYRTSELVAQLFSFSSLSVHVDTFRKDHEHQINDSIKFIGRALDDHLTNQSQDAQLDLQLFEVAKQRLLILCQNLTSTPIETIDQLPPLSCSVATCASDTLNYLILFIISTLFSGLVLIICVVQSYQARRQSRIPVAIHAEGPLISSLSTTHTSVNA